MYFSELNKFMLFYLLKTNTCDIINTIYILHFVIIDVKFR